MWDHREVASRIIRRTRNLLVNALRVRGRHVAWTPEFMALGNLLTLGRWAHQDARRRVLLHPHREAILTSIFPTLRRTLFITPDETRWSDQRMEPWRGKAQQPTSGPGRLVLFHRRRAARGLAISGDGGSRAGDLGRQRASR